MAAGELWWEYAVFLMKKGTELVSYMRVWGFLMSKAKYAVCQDGVCLCVKVNDMLESWLLFTRLLNSLCCDSNSSTHFNTYGCLCSVTEGEAVHYVDQ